MADPSSMPDGSELLVHADWLRRLARSLVRDHATAEDLVQETWLSALRSGPRDAVQARSWLARVLQNRLRSVTRSRARRERREAEVAPHEATPSAAALSERAESARLLLEAVLALPEAQREVLLLLHFEGLSVSRIAALTGCTEVAVRSRIARAVSALRVRLDQRAGDGGVRWLQVLVPLAREAQEPGSLASGASLLPSAWLGSFTMTAIPKVVAGAAAILVLGAGIRTLVRDEPARNATSESELTSADESLARARVDDNTSSVSSSAESSHTQASRRPVDRFVPPVAKIRGVLVDAESGAPIPYYALGIGSGEVDSRLPDPTPPPPVAEEIVTDHAGGFVTERAFEGGPMHAVLLEEFETWRVHAAARRGARNPRPALPFAHDPSSTEPVRLALAMGPSYFVQCSELNVHTSTGFVAELASPEIHGSTFERTYLVVADGPRGALFVARFPPIWRELYMPDEARFKLLDVDGHRAGRVLVSTRKAWPIPIVQVELGPVGSLVALVEADRCDAPPSVQLEVWRGSLAASDLAGRKPLQAVMTSKSFAAHGLGGRIQGEWAPRLAVYELEPEPHTIRVSADGFDDWIEVRAIEAGRNEITARLRRQASADGWIAGTVHTDSGAPPEFDWIVYLLRHDPERRAQPEIVQLVPDEVDGRWVGRFRAEALVPGDYDVWIRPGPRAARDGVEPNTTPRQRGIAVGRGDLRFDVHDAARTHVVEVTVLDAQGGAPISSFDLMLVKKQNGIEVDPRNFADGLARLELASDPSEGILGVAADGFATEFRSVPSHPNPDGVVRIEVRLVRGWGAAVNALQTNDGDPMAVADAEVVADGTVVGKTDERGVCFLRLAQRPATLTVRRTGYVLERARGALDGEGRLTAARPEPFRDGFAFYLRPN